MSGIGVLAQFEPAITNIETPLIEWGAVAPAIVLGVGAVLLLTFSSLGRTRTEPNSTTLYTVVVAMLAMLAAVPQWAQVQGWSEHRWIDHGHNGPWSAIGGAVGVDGFSVFVTLVLCVCVVLVALLADDYIGREGLAGPELHALLLLSATGGVIMGAANDLIVLFLGLETLSIAVYVMTAMHLRRVQSQEAGFKYFVLGSFASAFLLYGIALLYGATGTTNLVEMNGFLTRNVLGEEALLLAGIGMLLVGFGFKVAAAPFHLWTPDVYDGAPSPVTAYMASAVKVAAFAGMVRVLVLGLGTYEMDWRPVVEILAALSLVVGAVLAVVQTNVKRMLAYSSINHAGFLLMGLAAAGTAGTSGILFYLAAYSLLVIGSFGVVALVARTGDNCHELTDYEGLSKGSPVLAGLFTVFLLAQAGVPLTSGFFAKFAVIAAAVDAGTWWLAITAMLTAVVAAFLYLRIIAAMWLSDDAGPLRIPVPFATALALWAALVGTVAFGVFPSVLLDAARDAVPALVALAP